MKPHQLDQQRAEMMESLYQHSGRTCGTYTGLWQEFCASVGANFRDIDGAEIKADCIKAIGATESVLAEKHATACMEVIRKHLCRGWE